jgi:hypothetical protein
MAECFFPYTFCLRYRLSSVLLEILQFGKHFRDAMKFDQRETQPILPG